tara:strand:- start:117 stop:689 length:573 start_codon:yes stop_codon:yes gene_type:complete
MRILYLGPHNNKIISFLKTKHHITREETKMGTSYLKGKEFDFAISFRYQYKLEKEFIDYFGSKIINLHISYLPYNRGRDPNIWSFIDKTIKGVSIHQIDEGIDTGDIIIQKQVKFNLNNETLSSSYNKLMNTIENLFIDNCDSILSQKIIPKKQIGKGSCHKRVDLKRYLYLMKNLKYATPVKDFVNIKN